ncbi:hypothetical protein MIND_01273500 [Mycena indigotica]|uniref:F-box domain-containing protein n=1 Tax=Mycena indigotica TaxID=2126181 RepID=A0A8H6S3D0_9AGAR|nr:uncharacterized protein MIND_01273500 [Mycena indigotica]KAF7291296.1 hypothetical protein MIND_01273500 [Mycena indigotica]
MSRSTPLKLLDLPPEIIHSCLLLLSLNDLAHCLHTGNRHLTQIMSTSLDIRYRVEQEFAGVEENPDFPGFALLPLDARLQALRERERRWREFAPVARYSIEYPPFSGVARLCRKDCALWLFTVGDDDDHFLVLSHTLFAVDLALGAQPAQWRTVFTGSTFIEFISLQEHDLLVIVAITPCDDHNSRVSMDALILTLSSSTPHPLAAEPKIHLGIRKALDFPTLNVDIDVAGDLLVISTVKWFGRPLDHDSLRVFDWKRGVLIPTQPNPSHGPRLAFLSSQHLIAPNTLDNSLDVLCFGASETPDRRAFPAAPETSHIFFAFNTSYGGYGAAGTKHHVLAIRPAPLIQIIGACTAGGNRTIAWADWGPRCAGWLDAARQTTTCLASCGARGVRYAPDIGLRDLDGPPQSPSRLQLLDFGERAVAAARRKQKSNQFIDQDSELKPPVIVEPSALIFGEPAPDSSDLAPFAEPVRSEVAYVQITSKERYEFEDVVLTDECIIGRKQNLDSEQGRETLDVLFFG